jgi:hypothetical protein
LLISLASPPHDSWSGQEHEGRKSKGQPESDILLGVDHADLADQGSNIDEEVEVVVDSTLCDGRVDNNALSRWESLNDCVVERNLLDDQRRDVGFESSCSSPHNDNAQHEDGKTGLFICDDWRDG